jgi:hypothetical protein
MSTPRDAVQFTRESADRIAGVVRTLELTPARGAALNFGSAPGGASSLSVRFAYYTATTNWSVVTITGATTTNNTKTIQFAFPTNGTATATCINHLAPMPLISTVATNAVQIVLIAKEAGSWRLIGAQA